MLLIKKIIKKYYLRLMYLKAQSSLHDINKSIQYFEKAAKCYCVAAQVSNKLVIVYDYVN